MATMRPYDYAGGTLYTSTTYPGRKGYAMYYTGYFRQCGWGALFYNNTGKDIIVTNVHTLISANNGSFRATFSCKDVGTSVPNSSTFSKIGNDFDVTNYGSDITGWTSATANITIAKNHYFIVGVKSFNMISSNYFNIARTNNNNKKNCYYLENATNDTTSGTFVRVTETWKSQTPEIYIDYKDAAQPTYINGKQSESLEFWQGDSVSFTLSGYDSTRTITAPEGFSINRSGSTYTVTSEPSSTDKTATVPINGDNSSSTLYLKSKHPYYNSFTASTYTLRPGQIATLSEAHVGSSTLSYKNLVELDDVNGLRTNDNYTVKQIGNIEEGVGDFTDGVSTDITTNIQDGDNVIPDISKTLQITSKHWTPQDINVMFSRYKLLNDGVDEIIITNNTNLLNISDNSFNKIKITYKNSSDSESGLNISATELTLGESATIKSTTADTYKITIALVNDYTIATEVDIEVITAVNFNLIYPKSSIETILLYREGSIFPQDVDDYLINVTLPLYAYEVNPLDNNSGYIIPANYPIKIQLPTLPDNDHYYKLSAKLYFGLYTENLTITERVFWPVTSKISSDYSQTDYSIDINFTGDDLIAESAEIRTIILNFQKIIELNNNFNHEFKHRIATGPGSLLYNDIFSERLVFYYDEYEGDTFKQQNSQSFILNFNIYNLPNSKNSRFGELIKYQPIINNNIDNTIERSLLDAQRLNYLYGRIQTEPEYLVVNTVQTYSDLPSSPDIPSGYITKVITDSHFNNQPGYYYCYNNIWINVNMNYNDSLSWAMRENFFNITIDPTAQAVIPNFGDSKLISQSQYKIENLLSGLYDIVDKLKNSPECKSDQSLKDKLLLPRKYIASGCPICWDDSNPNSLQKIIDIYDGVIPINEYLQENTASPIMELLKSVESFQSYMEDVDIIYGYSKLTDQSAPTFEPNMYYKEINGEYITLMEEPNDWASNWNTYYKSDNTNLQYDDSYTVGNINYRLYH